MSNVKEFVQAMFGKMLSDQKEQPLFCGFPDDPKAGGNWFPKTMNHGELPKQINKINNNYVNISTYRPNEKGEYRAKEGLVVATHAIMLDDIGTKVKRSLVKLEPSWIVETSPDNYQFGYLLKRPVKNKQLAGKLISGLAAAGLTDKGAKGIARWMRLPFGVNTKPKHLIEGKGFKVRLVEWHPERRYSLKQIAKAYNINIDNDNGASKCSKPTQDSNNEVLVSLRVRGLWKAELEPGKHDITCPWVAQHTGQVDHGAVYYEPAIDNKQAGGFNCQHDHCAGRSIADLREFLGLDVPSERKKPQDQLEAAVDALSDLDIFPDENGAVFVALESGCFPLKSREARAHIMRQIRGKAGRMPKQSILSEVLALLEGQALCDSDPRTLQLRIAVHKGCFWYDLGDGRAIKAGKKDWHIKPTPPVFRRYSHQQKQHEPVKGGDPWKVFEYMNIKKEHRLEALVLLISYLVPDIPHPIFHPHGPQGGGKTTLCRIMKRLIDPSTLEVTSISNDMSEIVRKISRHHMPIFDNVSKISSDISDVLCIACTGGGIAKRTLYTDDDDYIYKFKRCVGLNGINLVITKPDLLDRTMLLHIDRIPGAKRKPEKLLWKSFDEAIPEILGGMFDILVKARALYPSVKLDELPRLADFAKWGYAIAEALGKGRGKEFLAAYEANIRRQNDEVLKSNSLCLAVNLLMKINKGYWEGTVKDAHMQLFNLVQPDKSDTTFPADPKNLRKCLGLIEATLVEADRITYRFSEKPKSNGFHVEFKQQK